MIIKFEWESQVKVSADNGTQGGCTGDALQAFHSVALSTRAQAQQQNSHTITLGDRYAGNS